MAYKDLREFIKKLEEEGELLRVKKEVDWNLEVGGITRRVQDLGAPAPLFENITGYPGFKILSGNTTLSGKNRYARLALALGLSGKASAKEIISTYMDRRKRSIPPKLVKEGPCHENVFTGDQIDLYKLPAPLTHEGDGGRYLCTWHANITKNAETGWVNYGMYRQMIHDRNTLSLPWAPSNEHWTMHHMKNMAERKRTEIAVAIGAEPLTPLIAATGIPAGVSEPDVIGGLRQEPLELVKCKTVDLEVPATSEIVIEGYVDPVDPKHGGKLEGPFGEYTGYMGSVPTPWPIMHVTAITHRDDPILTMSCMGTPVDDYGSVTSITGSGELFNELRNKGFPVSSVFIPPEGVSHFCAISSAIPFQTYPRDLAIAVWGTKMGSHYHYMVMVTNEDIDVFDPVQIMWALTTRVHPERDIWVLPRTCGNPLLPWPTVEERAKHIGAKVLFDATWPSDWPSNWVSKVASFKEMWPKEIQDKILSSWQEYGFEQLSALCRGRIGEAEASLSSAASLDAADQLCTDFFVQQVIDHFMQTLARFDLKSFEGF